MTTTKAEQKPNKKGIIVAILGMALALALIFAMFFLTHSDSKASIIYSDGEHSATITTEPTEGGQGAVEEEVEDIPTVESVDAETPVVDENAEAEAEDECEEGEECGKGFYADTSSPTTFKNDTIGKCIDMDGHYGAQCWDLADAFWLNYAGRVFTTCGSGAAKGTIANGCWQKNAGDDFAMIWDKTKLQAGDWVVFTNGQYGHVGMALGSYNNGYITLLGQNQGGASCRGGGSSANIINISLKNFGGAFRPKSYIKPEPKPTPAPVEKPVENSTATEETYIVKKKDTIGAVVLKLGWYSGVKGLYGDDGYAEKVAKLSGIKNRHWIYPGDVLKRVK